MKALRELYFANLTEFLSNRKALFLTIAFPVLFITVFGLVFTNQDKIDVKIGLTVADGGELGKQIAEGLEAAPKANITGAPAVNANDADSNPFSGVKFVRGEEAVLRTELKEGRLDGVIVIPKGISEAAAMRGQARAKRAMGAAADMDKRIAAWIDYGSKLALAEKVNLGQGAGVSGEAGLVRSSFMEQVPFPMGICVSSGDGIVVMLPRPVTLIVDPMRQMLGPILQGLVNHVLAGVNSQVSGEAGFLSLNTESISARQIRTIDYLLPGILAMSIMQLGLFATAQPLVALRVQGVLKRLGATPLPRTTLLVAYVALRLTIALLQTAIVMLIGHYAFKVTMVGSWWLFSGWILLGTLTFIALGFFIAAVSKNEESVIAISNIINLPMILLSGVFFPVDHLPKFLDVPIKTVPLNYLSDALRHTMLDTPPMHSAMVNAVGLSAWIVIMTVLAVRFFSWDSR